MKKSSETPCMKAFKVKSSHKHLMNCQRSFSDLLNKNVSVKKLKRQKKNVDNVKLKKQAEETLNKLSEPVNNAFTKKLSK